MTAHLVYELRLFYSKGQKIQPNGLSIKGKLEDLRLGRLQGSFDLFGYRCAMGRYGGEYAETPLTPVTLVMALPQFSRFLFSALFRMFLFIISQSPSSILLKI